MIIVYSYLNVAVGLQINNDAFVIITIYFLLMCLGVGRDRKVENINMASTKNAQETETEIGIENHIGVQGIKRILFRLLINWTRSQKKFLNSW